MHSLFPQASPESTGLLPGLETTVDNMITADLASNLIGGASAAVVCRGKLVYEGYHGFADAEEQRSITPDSLFRAASMTKPITAVAVMMQVEAGLLHLDDPVSRYLPCLGGMSVAETDAEGNLLGSHKTPRDFTVRNLLTHTSGLGSGLQFAKNCKNPDFAEGATLASKIPDWADSYLYFDPGTDFAYSPRVAFDVLAHLVEMTSGMDYAEFLRQRVFRPLGMTDTCFVPSEEQWSRMVRAYATMPDGSLRRVHSMDRVVFGGTPASYCSGGAGLATTLSDYVRFAGMLNNFGELDGVRLLSKQTVWGMQTPQLMPLMPKAGDYSWGLGMRVILKDNGSQAPLRRGAFGWSGAYGTHFWCDPVRDMFAVYMSNMTTAGGSGAKTARHIEQAVMAHVPE